MARRVYFAFDYEDVADFRANVVRMSWVTKPDREEAEFYDASLWEEAKKKGKEAIKRMINRGLEGTSVTVVLIGKKTYDSDWVKYEIKESYKRGNGLLGVYIHNIKDKYGYTDTKGENPFDYIYIERDGEKVYFSEMYPTYDWVNDDGYNNLGDWVEESAQEAGR